VVSVAFVPNANTLIVAGSDDNDALASAIKCCASQLSKARPICGTAFRLVGETWVKFSPDGPLGVTFRSVHNGDLAEMDASQYELLQKTLQEDDSKTTVCPVEKGRIADTGELVTYFEWPSRGPVLVPLTTSVSFKTVWPPGPVEDPGPIPWESVERVLGAKLRRADYFPPLFEVMANPTVDELQQMAAKMH